MKLSIRKFLLIHLIIALTIIAALGTIANYFLDEQAISYHLDNWLSQSTYTFQALLSNDLKTRDITKIQEKIDNIPAQLQHLYQRDEPDPDAQSYKGKFQLQIWDSDGKLLLRSANAPNIPLFDGKEGFSERIIDGDPWRIFTLYDKAAAINIVAAEPLDIRKQLGHKIERDAVYILLVSYPLIGLLIWLIIGYSFRSINRITDELTQRAPNFLNPVDSSAVPPEIQPLIDELNKLLLRLQQAFEREKSFSANAAHELRTPLAALKTQAQVAVKAITPLDREIALNKLIASVDRCSHVVQQLLTLSRVVPEVLLNEITELNLSKITTEVIASLAPFALEKNIEISLVGGEEKIYIMGIPTPLSILIRNLVDNSIRYTPPGGSVTVHLQEAKNNVTLKVIDNGPGIPVELRSQVFERFYRILGTKSPGSGLGLAIVQQIAELHKASVTLSTPNNGTGLEVAVEFPKNDIFT